MSGETFASIVSMDRACRLGAEIPAYARAVIEALRFRSPDLELLERLTESDWDRALSFSDRVGLTLALGTQCGAVLPPRVRERIDANLHSNAERWRRAQMAYSEIADAFGAAGLEFAVLKGFSQCPHFIRHPRHRAQGDFDLLLPRDQAIEARAVAEKLGYQALHGFEDYPLDHLPRMVRRTGWRWRGDFFDVDMPLALELHFQLWDPETERFSPDGVEKFWDRREARAVDGTGFTALNKADALAYSTLHILRHLLRGDLRAAHVYELAAFLDGHAEDGGFWSRWNESHPESLKKLEAVAFSLAARWFDCELAEPALKQINRLPSETARWLEGSAASPITSFFHPNKEEIWLHWTLLESGRDRAKVLRRRLLPLQAPRYLPNPHADEATVTWGTRTRDALDAVKFAAGRMARHTTATIATARGAMRWFAPSFPGPDYFRFFFTAALFNLGRYVFVLLYNLYLLRAGFRENVLGSVASAMTMGSLVGTWPAAMAIRRGGVRKMLLVAFPLIAGLSALQAWTTSPVFLIALAFLAGLVSSSWAVGISPAVAERTTERNRAFGFSLIFSSGVGIGIAGGFFGGRLPGWFARVPGPPDLSSYRAALLTGCALVLLAMWPLARMKDTSRPSVKRSLHRPSPLLIRFLIAIAIWNFGTGAFNPFFNAYFARMNVPVDRIGTLFSMVHLVQASAMLLIPIALRRFGMTRGISATQAATGVALLLLASARSPLGAAGAYAFYMIAQYASEPGMYAFLMNGVPEGERASASAMNFIAIFASQATAQALSGILLSRFGYPPVLAGAAIICLGGAMLFRILLTNAQWPERSPA